MRKKQINPKKIQRRYRLYNEQDLKSAYKLVKEKGISVKKAAKLFGVPNTTLRDRVAGRIDPDNYGNETLFSREEEKKLVEHLQSRAELGYGLSNISTQKLAGEMAYELKKKTQNKPMSNDWLYSFLKRWKDELNSIKPRQLDSSRAKNATPEACEVYFKNLKHIIEANGLSDKPQNIYNLDETGLQPEHKPPNVIGNPNTKVQAITSPRGCTTTLIACANALGNSLSPYFVFKGKRWNPELMNGACVGAKGTMSDSGWSNGDIFKEYLETHFLPLVGPRTAEDPILLIYDGHASHKGPETIKWAREKGIILFVLPAHTSHLLQPLDVAVFGPFKKRFYGECSTYLFNHVGQNITKYEICSLACSAYLKAVCPLNIQAGFRKCGIFPLDKSVVTPEKLFPCEGFREERPLKKIKAIKAGPAAVEKFLMDKEERIMKQAEEESLKKAECKRKAPCAPNPSGKAITSDEFYSEITLYQESKQKKQKKNNQPVSPKPSTSGLQKEKKITAMAEDSPDSDNDSDDEKCCVCGCFSPPENKKCQHLKIVAWGQCDSCLHWVHLSFCTEERVVRRQSEFLCPHCK